MNKEEIAEILAKPYAQQLLNGPEPARMAYNGLDGDPRVIPIGFWTDEGRILMGTVPKAAKVAALRKHPRSRSRSTRAPSRRKRCSSAAPPRSNWSRGSRTAT